MTRSAGRPGAAAGDFLGAWCGWILIGAAVLAPLLAYLSPLGFAPLMGVVGLLCLPAVRLTDADRPALIVLAAALVWAAVSTTWSPFHSHKVGSSEPLTLALQLPLYFSAVCGARRADPVLRGRALSLLAWGLAALGLLLLAEVASGAGIYRRLHESFYQPIRPDLAQKNVAQTTFVVALLWPVAVIGRLRSWRGAWILAPIVIGGAAAALAFAADAPVLALLLTILVVLATWRWPAATPRVLGMFAALLFLFMPGVIWLLRASGRYEAIQHALPLSWSLRMGYWSHALDWIMAAPLRGWGLDASRVMGPGIQLHPHNDELQAWLELGVIGAVAAAAVWGLTLARLARSRPSLPAAGAAASALVLLLYQSVNFGIWQDWMLGLAALVATLTAMVLPPVTERSST